MVSNIIISKLRNKEVVKRIITYCGKKTMQFIQLNKNEKHICWSVYHLPTNGNKAQAIMHNYSLSLKEVVKLISTTSNK